jgi:hypothetical protein
MNDAGVFTVAELVRVLTRPIPNPDSQARPSIWALPVAGNGGTSLRVRLGNEILTNSATSIR